MPRIEIDTRQVNAYVRSLARRMNDSLSGVNRAWIRGRIAMKLKRLILRDFDLKSKRGRGIDGTKWRKLRPATIARKGHDIIGIDTTEMRTSLQVRTDLSEADVLARFTSEHAPYFDAERPLLPETPPPEWVRELEEEIRRWAESQLAKQVHQYVGVG
jgi:hypothetical protein